MRDKSHYKVVLAVALVLAMAASLWFSAPATALTIDIGDPSATRLGSSISFSVNVTIEDSELLPIQSVDLNIYKSDDRTNYEVSCSSLRLTAGTQSYTTGGGDVDILATPDSAWGYGYGYGYAGWKGYAYYFGYGYGYGYDYGPTSIEYDVTWQSLRSWPTADYTIEVVITANSSTFTETKSVYLRRPSGGGGGGGGGAVADTTPPEISDVRICGVGVTKTTAEICWVTDERGTSQVEYWVEYKSILSKLTPLDEELVYEHCVLLTDLEAATTYYYRTISTDKSGNLAASDEYKFSTLGAPAAFTTSALSVSPTEVDIGGKVTISVLVTNTGDVTSAYKATLKINDVVVDTEDVTLAGGASKEVTFTTSRDVAGTYTVNVNGLSGTFEVRAAPAPPPPPPPVIPPPVEPINWWLIGGIIVGGIIIGAVIWQVVSRRRSW